MKEIVVARLEVVSALAKTLAYDYKENNLWPGDFQSKIAQIYTELEAAAREAKSK